MVGAIPDPRVDAVTRHSGSEPLRILELGSGTGTTAAALAVAGHDVVAIELQAGLAAHTQELAAMDWRVLTCDRRRLLPPGNFDVVAYFDGFGIGSDEDQRRLLRRIVRWLAPSGHALVDVLVPWYWARHAGNEEEFPTGSGVWYLDGFDADGCRMTERMWRIGHEDEAVTQSIRCY